MGRTKHRKEVLSKDWVKTGIKGFDELLEKGIPRGTSVLVAGGAGSGKTIFCLGVAADACKQGKKVLYMTQEQAQMIDRLTREYGKILGFTK